MKKKILVISPTFPVPLISGNRARIYTLLLNLKQLGHEVHFLYVNTEPFDESEGTQNYWSDQTYIAPYKAPHKTVLQRLYRKFQRILGRETGHLYTLDGWYDNTLTRFITNLSRRVPFDVVIVEYIFLSKALECFDHSVLKIIDTHDIYTNRHRLYLENNQNPHWYSTTERDEAKGLNRGDRIIAIQQKEKDFFTRLTEKSIVVVGHTVGLQKAPKLSSSPKSILFIGSSTPMNIKGIQEFIQSALPQIKSQHPDVHLIIAGGICDFLPATEHYVLLGKVQDLTATYTTADVVINPISYGTGLKIKTIEALGYAKPLVTTSVGAEGLEAGRDLAFLVADTPTAFAAAVLRILDDATFGDRLSNQAYEFATQWNHQNFTALANVLESNLPS